jgi:nuclear pore complex protein Nup93
MVDVLSKEISDALQKPQSFRASDPTLSVLSNDEIVQFATNTMEHYEKNQYVSDLIDDYRKNTVHILIQLLQFRVAYEKTEYEKALQIMNNANVIPLGSDMNYITALVTQFDGLAESIKKNVPELLLNVMDILYKMWAHYVSISTSVHNSVSKHSFIINFIGFTNTFLFHRNWRS